MSNVNNILPQYYLIICCEYYDKCAEIYDAPTQLNESCYHSDWSCFSISLSQLTAHNIQWKNRYTKREEKKNHNKIKIRFTYTHTHTPEKSRFTRSRFTNYECNVLRLITLWPHNYCRHSTLFLLFFSFLLEVKVKVAYADKKKLISRLKDSSLMAITAIFLTFGHTEGDGIPSFSDKFVIFSMEIRRLKWCNQVISRLFFNWREKWITIHTDESWLKTFVL